MQKTWVRYTSEETQLTINPYNLLSGLYHNLLFSSWHGIRSSNWCIKTHRPRNCLIPSPVEIKTYIRAPQGKRLLTHLTNSSTLIQSSTYRKLSGSIYWSGPFYFNSVYNEKRKYPFRHFTKIFTENGGGGEIIEKANFLSNIWRIYQLQWSVFTNKSHCRTESREIDLCDSF